VRAAARQMAGGDARLGLAGFEPTRRGETLLVVEPGADGPGPGPEAPLLERVYDARRAGATVLVLGTGEGELTEISHERLIVPRGAELDLDTVQHLVSAAAGENPLPSRRGRRRLRDRLSRLADALTAPPPPRW
ncbi:hypothetical protein ACWEGM_32000, partial [Streptomyces nigra]